MVKVYLITVFKYVKVITLFQQTNGNTWFSGKEFLSLLGLVLCLPQGAETDLLTRMDM